MLEAVLDVSCRRFDGAVGVGHVGVHPKQVSNDEASAHLLASKQPSKTFASPEDIGELAAFLCTKAAAQITGEVHRTVHCAIGLLVWLVTSDPRVPSEPVGDWRFGSEGCTVCCL